MAQHSQLEGSRFGQLMAIRPYGHNAGKCPLWILLCDCGKEVVALERYIVRGQRKSCGCLQRATIRNSSITHNMSKTKTYESWSAMLGRCQNPTHSSYPKYGAKGVRVHGPWQTSFAAFLADMGERPAGMTLDRRNPFGHYTPTNCKWATPTEQARNRRGDSALRILEKLMKDPALAALIENLKLEDEKS